MKPVFIAVACALVALCAVTKTGLWAGVPEEAQPARPTRFAAPLEFAPTWRQMLPMRGSTIVRPGREGASSHNVEVKLQLTYYVYKVVQDREGRVVELPVNRVKCYELLSDAPYTWANFEDAPVPLGNFALFSLDDGTSHLCWASYHYVKVADVTRPRDRIVAFHEYFGTRKTPPGPPEVLLKSAKVREARTVPLGGQRSVLTRDREGRLRETPVGLLRIVYDCEFVHLKGTQRTTHSTSR